VAKTGDYWHEAWTSPNDKIQRTNQSAKPRKVKLQSSNVKQSSKSKGQIKAKAQMTKLKCQTKLKTQMLKYQNYSEIRSPDLGVRLPRRLRLLAMTKRKGRAMTSKRGPFHNSPGPMKSYFTGLAPLIPSASSGQALRLRSGEALRGTGDEAKASHYARNSPSSSYPNRSFTARGPHLC